MKQIQTFTELNSNKWLYLCFECCSSLDGRSELLAWPQWRYDSETCRK